MHVHLIMRGIVEVTVLLNNLILSYYCSSCWPWDVSLSDFHQEMKGVLPFLVAYRFLGDSAGSLQARGVRGPRAEGRV